MNESTSVLLGLEDEFTVLQLERIDADTVHVVIEVIDPEGACPECGVLTSRIKERPLVRVKDLPASGQRTDLWWLKRRLVCREPACGTATFTQQSRAVPARSRLAKRRHLAAADLRSQDWLRVSNEHGTIAKWAGIIPPDVPDEFVVNRPEAIPTAVAMTGRISLHAATARDYYGNPDVAFVPGQGAYVDERGKNSMRLNFSGADDEEIRADEVRDECSEAVIVAKADLGRRHAVILVDDRHRAQLQQPALQGLESVDGMPVYTSRGAGAWGPPVRVAAPPEIAILELTAA